MRVLPILFAALLLAGCSGDDSSRSGPLTTRQVTMPDGRQIQAEAMIQQADLQRGMMFRKALPEGRGMLFLHDSVSAYTYWMYQVQVPLDMIFIDAHQRVLGVVASAPPCTTHASECPKYGGFAGTKFVLELNGGEARKYAVEPGRFITF